MASVADPEATPAEAGQTIEERAAAPEQQPLEGFRKALSSEAGGEAPDGSVIVLQGGALPLDGEFDKGEFVELLVRVRISAVSFVDKIDKHGNVTAVDRKHTARLSSVRRGPKK